MKLEISISCQNWGRNIDLGDRVDLEVIILDCLLPNLHSIPNPRLVMSHDTGEVVLVGYNNRGQYLVS
jgi:hypothetical protein